uniref:Uncharacterized protein n=1 Tax=Branchiostoma floridae TaxID=7739 RepID=C3Y8P7_BRAFL|eukprot:XP_002607474.1 hypothetical protein BRAFLDRAFT_69906 [Branchiostoma floridae]
MAQLQSTLKTQRLAPPMKEVSSQRIANVRGGGHIGTCASFLHCRFCPQHIPGAFVTLRHEADNPCLMLLTEYIRTTWLDSNVWAVNEWCVSMESGRIHNDFEGCHLRLKRFFLMYLRLQRRGILIYSVRGLLGDKQRAALIKLCMVIGALTYPVVNRDKIIGCSRVRGAVGARLPMSHHGKVTSNRYPEASAVESYLEFSRIMDMPKDPRLHNNYKAAARQWVVKFRDTTYLEDCTPYMHYFACHAGDQLEEHPFLHYVNCETIEKKKNMCRRGGTTWPRRRGEGTTTASGPSRCFRIVTGKEMAILHTYASQPEDVSIRSQGTISLLKGGKECCRRGMTRRRQIGGA